MKTNTTLTANRIIIMLVLVLLSNVKMFGQQAENIKPVSVAQTLIAETDSQMELVSWLMGTKQSHTTNAAEAVIATKSTAKKQFINSGMQTNRLLNKTFLKKAVNKDVATV